MLISSGQINITTLSGSASANTASIRGLLRNVVVKPTTESTIYDIKIINQAGATIYERTSETGTLSEINEIPIIGMYTVTISNATRDEDFLIQLISEN